MCWFANRLLGRPLAIGFEAVNIRLLNGILNGISLLVQIYLNLFSTMFSSDHLIGELCGPLKRFTTKTPQGFEHQNSLGEQAQQFW